MTRQWNSWKILLILSFMSSIFVHSFLSPQKTEAAAYYTRNLSLGSTVSASSNVSIASKAVDGNAAQNGTTEWYNVWGQFPMWFQTDLGSSKSVVQIKIKARYGTTVEESGYIAIYGSNDAAFAAKTKLVEYNQANTVNELVLPVAIEEEFRYVRVEKIPGQGSNSLGFAEFEVWGTEPDDLLYANIAHDKPATATSYYGDNASYAPGNGNDGNGSAWVSKSAAGQLQYWQVDLGTAFRIDKLQMVPRDNRPANELRSFRVLVSNASDFSSYKVIASVGGIAFTESVWSALVSESNAYRYVRVEKTTVEGAGFKEFRVLSANSSQMLSAARNMQFVARLGGFDSPGGITWNSTQTGTLPITASGDASALCAGKATISASNGTTTLSTLVHVADNLVMPSPTAPDLFTPFLTGETPVISTVISEATANSGTVIVKKVLYTSNPVSGRTNQIYSVIASPAAAGTYPGVLILHGGTQCAQESLAIQYASKGYIAVTPELPGISDPAVCSTASTGQWKSEAYGSRQLTAIPDAKASSIFEGEVAALQAFYLLKAQPGVDAANIGIRGLSWGGYSTAMLSSLLGNQVKAAFAIYGSGFYDYGSYFKKQFFDVQGAINAANWLKELDAGRRAGGITANYFSAAASNDSFFWPTAVMKTLSEISGPKNQLFSPNTDHSLSGVTDSSNLEFLYFNYLLKGQGTPFPRVATVSSVKEFDGSLQVQFDVTEGATVASAKLYYSLPNVAWNKRVWTAVNATQVSGTRYEGVIPASAVAQGADWYALTTDSTGASASSLIVSSADLP
ncbi:discoidin domain-containing protein [Paenibacillus sp. GCM10023252]|uniref:discoidin domain-containing protein n=1 Tax=Paenibacillus sp. GCM10023252 TaxID=3252649 RepID=UPI00361A0041